MHQSGQRLWMYNIIFARLPGWLRMAAMNTARSGFFSSDRTIRSYMKDIWGVTPAL